MANDRFYKTRLWAQARAQQLLAHPACAVPGCAALASHVDHAVARARGGDPYSPRNLVSYCASHHNEKTARYDGGFGRQRTEAKPLRAKGCDAQGNPLSPDHHWRKPRITGT